MGMFSRFNYDKGRLQMSLSAPESCLKRMGLMATFGHCLAFPILYSTLFRHAGAGCRDMEMRLFVRLCHFVDNGRAI